MNIKIVNKSAHDLPHYATEQSAGLDLRANLIESITLGPLDRAIVPTGLYIELPPGYEAQVRPRSGLAAKYGITVLNSPGTIDADYRGEIGVDFPPGNRDKIPATSSGRHQGYENFEALKQSPGRITPRIWESTPGWRAFWGSASARCMKPMPPRE